MSEPKRTQFAQRALVLADVFKFTVGKQPVPGLGVGYRVELSMPEGESTEGGLLAVQHVGLVADNGAGTIVIGSLHHLDKRAELRRHDQVDELHRQRWNGTPFPVDPAIYAELSNAIERFARDNKFEITLQPPAAPVSPRRSPTAPMTALRSTAPRLSARTAGPVAPPAGRILGLSHVHAALVVAAAALAGVALLILLRR